VGALTGLTTIKRFSYRGDPTEEWSNTYHFRDPPPATSAAWKTFADAFIAVERSIWQPSTHLVRAYGYADDSDKPISVWSHDYLLEGTQVPGTGTFPAPHMAGDQAALMWWRLDHKNSHGKWVYLRKYMHGGSLAGDPADNLETTYAAALNQLADGLGQSVSWTHGGIRARTGDWPILAHGVSPFVTTRTLKRRGKRPLASTLIGSA
jgi:hypothetical protein